MLTLYGFLSWTFPSVSFGSIPRLCSLRLWCHAFMLSSYWFMPSCHRAIAPSPHAYVPSFHHAIASCLRAIASCKSCHRLMPSRHHAIASCYRAIVSCHRAVASCHHDIVSCHRMDTPQKSYAPSDCRMMALYRVPELLYSACKHVHRSCILWHYTHIT